MKSRSFWIGILGGMILAALIGFFAVPAMGFIDMTATGSSGPLDWWGNLNWRSSLMWRAPDQQIPETATVTEGLEHYQSSCLQCHGAPDVSPAEWAFEMHPMPPRLWGPSAEPFSDGELFYIVKNGVRMTGMPAFGPEHDDADIWNIAAAVRQLDRLSAEQQQQLSQAAQRYQHSHEHGEHLEASTDPKRDESDETHYSHSTSDHDAPTGSAADDQSHSVDNDSADTEDGEQ